MLADPMSFPVEPVELFLVIINFPNKLVPDFKPFGLNLFAFAGISRLSAY